MQKRSVFIILLILLFGLSIFIFKVTSVPILSNLAQQIARPAKIFLYAVRTTSAKNPEAQKLEKENQDLQEKLIDFEKIKRDNQALRDQFETQETRELKLLPAKIIGSQGSIINPTTLIIDQGEESGIKKGMAVVLKNNLLGKIDKVSENYSKVILTQSEQFSTLAKTSDTNALGIALGRGDFILFDQVSINDIVRADQLLLTKGEVNQEGFGIPPDFIIGKVSSVNKNESLPYQSAKIETDVNASHLNTVFVIK